MAWMRSSIVDWNRLSPRFPLAPPPANKRWSAWRPGGDPAAALTGLMLGGTAYASSHREAPLIAEDPSADNTDLYAWVQPGTHDKLYVVANYIPLEEPAGGPNFHKFSDDVLYSVHIARGAADLNEDITYYFRFFTTDIQRVDAADLNAPLGGGKEFFSQLTGQRQHYAVYKKVGRNLTILSEGNEVAPLRIGPRTFAVAQREPEHHPETEYNDAFAARFVQTLPNGEGRVWAGPRDDGFYVDLGGVFDLANIRPQGVAQDGVSGFNTHSIVLEIPTTKLTANGQLPGNTPSNDTLLGIWAAASRK